MVADKYSSYSLFCPASESESFVLEKAILWQMLEISKNIMAIVPIPQNLEYFPTFQPPAEFMPPNTRAVMLEISDLMLRENL